MNYIPREVDCKSQTVNRCDWYMAERCKKTCNYYEEQLALGVGAMCIEDIGRLEAKLK